LGERARDIIALRNREQSRQATFRKLWQETADLMFPRENQITDIQTPGDDKARKIYDTTAIFDSQNMASGLSAALIPTGQKFFGLVSKDRSLGERPEIKRYLSYSTEITHDEMFESNFMLQLNETLRSLVVFGTGNLYSEWDYSKGGLNFRDWDISTYQILENNHGIVDTVILSFSRTARQAVQQFGYDNVSEDIQKASEDIKKENNVFEFIHIIRPRSDRNPTLTDNLNMPYESIYVDVKGKKIVDEGGFEELPFAVPRWEKSGFEVYGRGQGTEVLPLVKMLNQAMLDFIELSNKWTNPPLEVLSTFEGRVNVTPNAVNFVQERNSIGAIQQNALGNFPITKEFVEYLQEKVHQAFYRDIFVPLTDLTQRMTTVEVAERIREGLRRLASPVARLEAELLRPNITRSVKLLMRNGRLPPPPMGLTDFGIEYRGELALALRSQQAKGFMQFMEFAGSMSQFMPESLDWVNIDTAMPDMAESWGVKTEHLTTEQQRADKKAARQQAMQAQQVAQAAEVASQAYSKTNKAPEEGSPAGKLMEA